MKTGIIRYITLLFIILTALAVPTTASAQRGEKSLGIKAGYNTRNESAAAGIYFQYRFSKYFRLAPDVEYILRHTGSDALSFNCNAQVPLLLGGSDSRVNFYPLAGLNYTSWNYHPAKNSVLRTDASNDVSTRVNRLGLNVGAGFEYHIKPTLKIAIEGKYTLASHNNFGAISASIGYVF